MSRVYVCHFLHEMRLNKSATSILSATSIYSRRVSLKYLLVGNIYFCVERAHIFFSDPIYIIITQHHQKSTPPLYLFVELFVPRRALWLLSPKCVSAREFIFLGPTQKTWHRFQQWGKFKLPLVNFPARWLAPRVCRIIWSRFLCERAVLMWAVWAHATATHAAACASTPISHTHLQQKKP